MYWTRLAQVWPDSRPPSPHLLLLVMFSSDQCIFTLFDCMNQANRLIVFLAGQRGCDGCIGWVRWAGLSTILPVMFPSQEMQEKYFIFPSDDDCDFISSNDQVNLLGCFCRTKCVWGIYQPKLAQAWSDLPCAHSHVFQQRRTVWKSMTRGVSNPIWLTKKTKQICLIHLVKGNKITMITQEKR